MKNEIHIRYQCCSQPFTDILLEKGFEEIAPDNKGKLHEVRIFILRDMLIRSSLRFLSLERLNEKMEYIPEFKGASIHDNVLLSFIGLPIRKGKQDVDIPNRYAIR